MDHATSPTVALVVTGSVAAIKTLPLLEALRENGLHTDVILTRAPKEWNWVDADKIADATGYKPLDADAPPQLKTDLLQRSNAILVAPASADFIAQLAHADSDLAKAILEAAGNRKLFVAPAMNYKMWHHPAVRRNCETLVRSGVVMLGPVKGPMACGDEGYGRMIDVNDMADAVCMAMNGNDHPALALAAEARHAAAPEFDPSQFPRETDILVALTGPVDMEKFTGLAELIRQSSARVAFVVTNDWRAQTTMLEKLSGRPVITDHYQFPEYEGMEHIRFPERTGLFFFPFLTPATASAMARGGGTLLLDMVLASKAPIVTTAAALQGLPKPLAETLIHDGISVADPENDIFHQFSPLKTAIRKTAMTSSASNDFDAWAGKNILVLAGNPRERVDSFRFYANDGVGIEAMKATIIALRDAGANVTAIAPFASRIAVDGVITIDMLSEKQPIESATHMTRAAAAYTTNVPQADMVLQLAGISSITCSHPVGHKIQKTGNERDQLFEVAGNIDILKVLQGLFPNTPINGFDRFQNWIGDETLRPLIITPDTRDAAPEIIQDIHHDHMRVIVTTARTEEVLTTTGDYITNFFTGRQGQEIARAFAKRNAEVTLISGPTILPNVNLPNVRTLFVRSAKEMLQVAQSELAHDVAIFVGSAAVADFGVAHPADVTGLKTGEIYRLQLIENPNIVGTAARWANRPTIVVSFAAQSPETIEDYARAKFHKMGVDLTVANPIGNSTVAARDPTRNQVMLVDATGIRQMPEMGKNEVAEILADEIMTLYSAHTTTGRKTALDVVPEGEQIKGLNL